MQLPEYSCQFRKSAAQREVQRVVGPSSGSSWQIVFTYLFTHAWNHHYKTVNAVSSSGLWLLIQLKEHSY